MFPLYIAGLEIYNETGKADKEVEILLGSIKLPPSLFETLEDEKLLNVGVWFSLHRTGDFFPQQENSTAEDAVATPIISATVGGQRVRNLTEPVTFLLRLLNQVQLVLCVLAARSVYICGTCRTSILSMSLCTIYNIMLVYNILFSHTECD